MASDPYRRPDLYELAFSWRDYAKAVDFIIEAAQLAGVTKIASMVELGCGPAQYAREFARRGIVSYGVDLSPEMVALAQHYWAEEGLPGRIIEADMRRFRLEQPASLACCMMATFALLLTNGDVLDHFDSVADNLTTDGIYVIELPHPAEVFDRGSRTSNVWEMKTEESVLHIDWASDAVFDPITEVSTGTVRFKLDSVSGSELFEARELSRGYSLGLLRALLDLGGRLQIASIYGDLNVSVPFDNDKKAWRMVLVLRKVS